MIKNWERRYINRIPKDRVEANYKIAGHYFYSTEVSKPIEKNDNTFLVEPDMTDGNYQVHVWKL